MKKRSISLHLSASALMLSLLAGCASVSYESPEGAKVSYTRVFSKVESVTATDGEKSVTIQGADSHLNTENVAAITAAAVQAAKTVK